MHWFWSFTVYWSLSPTLFPFVSSKITLSQCQINREQKREQLSNLSNTSNNLITVILNWKICTQKKGGENERERVDTRKKVGGVWMCWKLMVLVIGEIWMRFCYFGEWFWAKCHVTKMEKWRMRGHWKRVGIVGYGNVWRKWMNESGHIHWRDPLLCFS